ncbi:hypothetical protein RJ639_041705 [Escallonia herrerae]|uniref:Uncharacterized protein n=1 Tax=Escallonia herrerae TaxID=1293975 RepID=A0AA88WQ55_9ASTE|nr:hypothetical protein RJ639_041705 [Escallonia herrerae]
MNGEGFNYGLCTTLEFAEAGWPLLYKLKEVEGRFMMIVHKIISEGIKVDEQMQVAAIIDKLSNSWKEFQKGLRHKQSELSIVNLMARLQIEEEARKQDKKNEALANNTHANHANSHQGNGNANGNGAKISFLINPKIVGVKKPKP